jgi:methylmalonyl-CoA mutase N-terminal domain/subunit
LTIDDEVEARQLASLQRVKAQRSQAEVGLALDEIRRSADKQVNILPAVIDAARKRVTVGEVIDALADVFGRYEGAVI